MKFAANGCRHIGVTLIHVEIYVTQKFKCPLLAPKQHLELRQKTIESRRPNSNPRQTRIPLGGNPL
jgi:hypothetical protein